MERNADTMASSSVKRLAATLMDASMDKDPDVQEQIYSSLCFMGDKAPVEVLEACDTYLRQHDKLSYAHRTIILRAMETVIRNSLSALSKETAKLTILLASMEMTKSKDIVFEWQQAASNVLVAVGRRYINSVMEEILLKFQPGVLPHFFIMQTLANLSTANVFGMVPFLNSILGTMLPMLAMAKQDPMKAVFCVALQHFSESILEYLANLDQAPDPTVRKETFSCDLFSAYDVLFNSWLQNRESKVRLAVVEALGPLSHLLPNEKLEDQLGRLLPGILSMYKKNVEPFYVTKSLCQILESAVCNESRTLEPLLESVLSVLHTQICSSMEAPTQMLVRNRNEILRCFTVLASSFPDHLLAFLLPKLEANNPKVRVGTLIILKQVINSAASLMEVKKPLILAAVRPPLQDGSNRVRKAMVQLISTLAHHGYLEQPGGEVMVDYIIRLCCVTPEMAQRRKNSDPEDVTDESVRRISINTLYLVSTTVERMTDILWPHLLEFVVPVQYNMALTPVCKSLVHLGQKKLEDGVERFLINYNMNGNLPSPHAILTRLLVASSSPESSDGRSAAALHLLSVMQINIHPTLGPYWEQEIPPILRDLEETTENPPQQTAWEERLLKLLVGSLQAVADDSWIGQLSQEMRRQLNGSIPSAVEKGFLYKCIGSTLASCANREVVRRELQELLTSARYQDDTDREGLAVAFGICAAHHLDDTLNKMAEFLKSDIMKKNTGIFNLFKDRADGDLEKMKAALILCYGYVAVGAPIELVLPRIESDILRNVFLYFHTKVLGIKVEPKDVTLKLSLIRCVSMIALAICSSSQAGFFVFSRKADLISQLLEFLKLEPADSLKSAVRPRTLAACSYLVKLEPPLSDAEKAELINMALSSVFSLPPIPTGSVGELHKETLYRDTMEALKELLSGLLAWNITPQGLQEMFQILNPWIRSSKEQERERALELSSSLLEAYLQKLNVNCVVSFHNLGLLIGRLSPRCSDSLASIRQHSLDCIYYLLQIQLRYEGFALDHKEEQVEKLQTLRSGLQNPDSIVLYHTCFEIAMIVGKRLPPEQLTSLLFITFEGLSDPDTNCSRAATVMINTLLKDRGSILLSKVPEIIQRVQEQLEETPEEHVRKAAVQTLYILATQHVKVVVSSLLSSPIPYDSEMCTLWGALSSDPPLTSQVLTILLEKMTADVPFKESKTSLLSSAPSRVATLLPLSATCALREVLSEPKSSSAVQELFPPLFVALLLRVSSMVGVQLPKNLGSTKERKNSTQNNRNLDPCSSAVEALTFVLLQGGSEEVALGVAADGGWDNMKREDTHHMGVSSLSSCMVQYAGPKLPDIIRRLQASQSSAYDNHRVTATAFLAQLLQSSDLSDLIFVEPLMENMTNRLKDSSVTVRMLAIRGLGNIASGYPDKVRKHGSHLLTAMINAMDDREDPDHIVTQEAMSNLSRLLPHVQDTDMHSLLIHTAIRIRPFFDHEREELRRSSIILFGNLTKSSAGHGEETLFEQIMNGLVTLLLHLEDPKLDVVKACKFALQMCAPSLNNQGLADMFTSHLHPDRGLHYGEFMNDVCKHLLQGYPDMIPRLIQTNVSYFKSIWADIRAAAPLFIGFLVLHMQPDQCKMVDLDHLVTSLIVLLKDPVPSVRIKASETMGRLVKFV